MSACVRCYRKAVVGGQGFCRDHAYSEGVFHRKVPREKALALVEEHLALGHSFRSLSEAAGLGPTTVWKFYHGKSQSMRHQTYVALMEAPRLVGGYVPSWPATRRIRALRAAGWKIDELAAGMGVDRSIIVRLAAEKYEGMETTTWHRVRDFYQAHELSPVRPADKRVSVKNWPLPLDWDNIDDPEEDHMPLTPAQGSMNIPLTEDIITVARFLVQVCGGIVAAAHTSGVNEKALGRIVRVQQPRIPVETVRRLRWAADKHGWTKGTAA